MHTITARFAGGNASEIANNLMQALVDAGAGNPSVTWRESGNEMNPQVHEIALPDGYDAEKVNAGILPGQVLNSPLEGPGPVSRESQASLIPTPIPEQTSAQKAASKENEAASAKQAEVTAAETDEEIAKREAYEAEREAEWKEENRRAAARGVTPVGPTPGADKPDLKVAVVPDTGTPANDNGLGEGESSTSTGSTSSTTTTTTSGGKAKRVRAPRKK